MITFFLYLALAFSFMLGLLGVLILLILVLSVFAGVPFVPTHMAQAKRMMELGGVGEGKLVIDLGSGAGRLLFLAAGRGASAIGYELNPILFWYTRWHAWRTKQAKNVSVKLESLYKADVSRADVVFTFLFPQPMIDLDKKLFAEMKPGSKVISYGFKIPGREPVVHEQAIYVYDVPARA